MFNRRRNVNKLARDKRERSSRYAGRINIGKLRDANHGEIAARVFRTVPVLGLPTGAVYPEDDASGLIPRRADESFVLSGRGVTASLG